MSLRFSKAFTRRIECDRFGLDEGGEIGQPALRVSNIVTDNYKESLAKGFSQRGDKNRVRRSVQPAHNATRARTRDVLLQLAKFGQYLDEREQLWERHGGS